MKLGRELKVHVTCKIADLERQLAEAHAKLERLERDERDRAVPCRGLYDPDQSPLTEQGEEEGVVRMPDGSYRFAPLNV